MVTGSRIRMGLLLACLGPLATASAAPLADGRLEISQACASVGCFPGDLAGYPITITSPGSYVLTGNLTLSMSVGTAVNGIEIRSDDVSIDLNGFAIRCVRTVAPVGPCKTLKGTGDAIEVTTGRNVHVSNGTLRDFPQHGINGAAVTTSYSLDSVRVINNGMNGVDSSGSAQISRAFATDNGQYGILIRSGTALVLDAYTNVNVLGGIWNASHGAAIGRGQFRDRTLAVTAADLVECILDGVTQVCPPR